MDVLQQLQHFLFATSAFIFLAFTIIYPWKDKAVSLLFPIGAFLNFCYASYILWVEVVAHANDLEHYYSIWPPSALLFLGSLLELTAIIRIVRSQVRHIKSLLLEQQIPTPDA